MKNPKVLIVGAGPVGLSAALFLRKMGLTPRIIDRLPKPTPYSKALGINPRTLDLLHEVDVSQRLINQGLIVRQAHFYYNNKLVTRIAFDKPQVHEKWNFMLVLPQFESERIFTETLAQRGIQLQRSVELVDFRQSDNKVSVTLKTPTSQTTEDYDYVFGADGARSVIRHKLNFQFPGQTFHQPLYLADFKSQGHALDRLRTMLGQEHTCVMFPVTKNIVRLFGNYRDLRDKVHQGVKLGEEVWHSEFTVNHRVASSFHSGRVFIGGDASHVHSPVGGRGMNIGIEDAYTFSKLLKHEQLHRYTEMRKPVLDAMVSRIKMATEFALANEKASRRKVLPYVLPIANLLGGRNMRKFVLGLDHPQPTV